jgi:hypothetical protein
MFAGARWWEPVSWGASDLQCLCSSAASLFLQPDFRGFSKLGVLMASLAGGITGYFILRMSPETVSQVT